MKHVFQLFSWCMGLLSIGMITDSRSCIGPKSTPESDLLAALAFLVGAFGSHKISELVVCRDVKK